MFGISGGGGAAAGLVARNPERVIALILRVPGSSMSLATPAALKVPTFVILAENDAVVNNAAQTSTFAGNRAVAALGHWLSNSDGSTSGAARATVQL